MKGYRFLAPAVTLFLAGCSITISRISIAPSPAPSFMPNDIVPTFTVPPPTLQGSTQTPYLAAQIQGEWGHITVDNGLCTNTPLFIGSDFIGTGTTQICFWTGSEWQTREVPQGSRVRAANRFPPGGGLEIATDAGLCFYPFQGWKCETLAERFPYAEVLSLVPLGTESVYRLADAVDFRTNIYRIPDIVGAADARTTWIAVSGDSSEGAPSLPPEIWVGTNGYGLVVINVETGTTTRYTTAEGLPGNNIRDVQAEHCTKFCDFRDIWAATDGGIGHWDGAHWEAYTTEDGLPSNDVRGVAPERQNVVWAATARGAAYFDGQAWQAFTQADGLLVEDLQGVLLPLNERSIWFNTLGQGLVTFTPLQEQP
jgi:ligand-binding sensor domain-containing protein